MDRRARWTVVRRRASIVSDETLRQPHLNSYPNLNPFLAPMTPLPRTCGACPKCQSRTKVPIPGDTHPLHLAAIYQEASALAYRLGKPLSGACVCVYAYVCPGRAGVCETFCVYVCRDIYVALACAVVHQGTPPLPLPTASISPRPHRPPPHPRR